MSISISIEEKKQVIDVFPEIAYAEDPTLVSRLDELNGEVIGVTSSAKIAAAIASKEAIAEAVNIKGGNITADTPFSQYADIILFLIEELKDGMFMINAEEPNIKFEHNTITKYTPNADDVITFDISELEVEKCSTMELWLTLVEVVSFSIADVTWIEEPSFDTANMLYCVVLRWDGEKVLANVAYSVEVG